MKILVIGATHAGTFATQQILTDHPDAEVTVYERNNNLSFLSCGIALWVGDHVSDPDKMFYSSPEALAKLGANMQMEHDVLNIDPATKTVEVKDLKTGTVTTDTYDKLHNRIDANHSKYSRYSRFKRLLMQKLVRRQDAKRSGPVH